MKITKYEHACFTVELNGKTLILDPGSFTQTLKIPTGVVAIVITHGHEDHFNPDILAAIYDKNPDSILVTLPEIADMMLDHSFKKVAAGDTVTIEPFTLEFFGGKHAEIHDTYVQTGSNLGVMINDTIYYPGDSFTEPHRPVTLLAIPTSGPWLKVGEVIDFLRAVKPTKFFPVHDFHNSEAGNALVNRLTGPHAEAINSQLTALTVGESLDI